MGEEGTFRDSDLSSKSKCLLGTLRSLKGVVCNHHRTCPARAKEPHPNNAFGTKRGRGGDGEWGPFAARTSRLLSSLSIIPAGREGPPSLPPSLTKIHYVRTAHGERESKCMHALVH